MKRKAARIVYSHSRLRNYDPSALTTGTKAGKNNITLLTRIIENRPNNPLGQFLFDTALEFHRLSERRGRPYRERDPSAKHLRRKLLVNLHIRCQVTWAGEQSNERLAKGV
jgi:hypothetical protein